MFLFLCWYVGRFTHYFASSHKWLIYCWFSFSFYDYVPWHLKFSTRWPDFTRNEKLKSAKERFPFYLFIFVSFIPSIISFSSTSIKSSGISNSYMTSVYKQTTQQTHHLYKHLRLISSRQNMASLLCHVTITRWSLIKFQMIFTTRFGTSWIALLKCLHFIICNIRPLTNSLELILKLIFCLGFRYISLSFSFSLFNIA